MLTVEHYPSMSLTKLYSLSQHDPENKTLKKPTTLSIYYKPEQYGIHEKPTCQASPRHHSKDDDT